MLKYDAVVIGAGNGGLAAALTLALKNKKVLVLEKGSVPGGFATSFIRGRFEFEASLHELCDYGTRDKNGNLYKLFKQFGVVDKLEFVTVPEAFKVICLDTGEEYSMPFGRKEFIDKMESYVPGSRQSMNTFFDLADETSEAMAYLTKMRGRPDSKVLRSRYPNFMRVAAYPVKKVLDAIKMPQKAQRILNVYWSYLGAPESQLSFIHYALMVNLYIDLGAQIPTKRSHGISLTLAEEIIKKGGEIWYDSEVSEILVENGRVAGVKLSDGLEIRTAHVISNASPHTVYGKMVDPDDIPSDEIKLANARSFAGRGLSMFLGLNRSAKELGLDSYSYFIYHSLDSDKEFETMKKPYCGSQVTVCLNNGLPNCSPEGTAILYFTSLSFTDCYADEIGNSDYFDVKDKIADTFIDTFEKATGVGIRAYIEEIEVGTPLTYAHYTDSPQGTIYGYLASGLDNLMPRLMTMYDEKRLPGLRFAGGHSMRVSGYNSSYLSGNLSANLTLSDMKEDAK